MNPAAGTEGNDESAARQKSSSVASPLILSVACWLALNLVVSPLRAGSLYSPALKTLGIQPPPLTAQLWWLGEYVSAPWTIYIQLALLPVLATAALLVQRRFQIFPSTRRAAWLGAAIWVVAAVLAVAIWTLAVWQPMSSTGSSQIRW